MRWPAPRVELSSFVGRATEQLELTELLLRVRLLTLTGPGGVGKSRLATRVALRARGSFADGVVAVDVAQASDETELGRLLSDALGGTLDMDLQAAIGYLSDAELLLVLDNCEHLVEACADVILALVVGCPRMRILVTSREALRTVGERTWTVSPLPLPAESAPYADVMASDAVALFVARAREIDSTFTVDAGNAGVVAAICRRVDGLPLALELAAERTRVLTVGQIESELAVSFAMLDSRSAARPHQQTLGANLERSIRLLDDGQHRLLRRLAVFEGDWTLEAARQVCGDDDLAADDILAVLGELVSKSLVQTQTGNGATRFTMLRTTREPAARLLESAGEADALRARHAQWCAGLGADSPFPTYHPTLVQEAANIRAALTWTVQREQVDTNAALSLANAMHHAWATNRANAEALTCYEQVLGLGGGQPGLRALALCHAGVHARRLGQVAAAVSFVEQAREIATQIDDPTMQRLCVAVEADLDLDRGDLESAQRLLEQLMWLNCDNCCKTAIAASLAMVYVEQADTERAADLVAPWLGSLEDPACAAERASLLRVEAAIAAAQDSFSRAEWSLSQAVEAALAVGDSSEALLALRAQTDLARRRGLGATARRTARKALAIAPSLDGALARIRLLETCALALGGPAGAPLAHFAGHQRRQLGFAYWPSERASLAIFDISHPQLAPNSIQAALDSASELLGPEQRGEDLANGLTASLTPREREVARLLAAGSNTRQIADALVISGATARAHLEHIRTKLGVATRGDVAARLAFESPLSTS